MSSVRIRLPLPGPLVKRLRHRPFTAVTWVRFPYGSPNRKRADAKASALFLCFFPRNGSIKRYRNGRCRRGGASRSELKSIDCRGQSHHNSIGNLPPATWQIQPAGLNGTTRYTEPNVAALTQRHPAPPGAGPVANITRLVERYHPIQQQTFLRWTIQIQMYHGSGPAGRLVVLRAANQTLLIAGGNHTIIPSADCRRYSGGTIFWAIPFTHTGYTSNVADGRFAAPTIHLFRPPKIVNCPLSIVNFPTPPPGVRRSGGLPGCRGRG